MFASFAVTALLFAPLFVRAAPTPVVPGPGVVYNQGGICRTTWEGDADRDSQWKSMNIQLMSGSNFQMNHLTTLTETPVDGTVDGELEFECPEVAPYSAIYFFQFTARGQATTWTTRFTIADATGKSVPPPESVQPDGARIGWGNGVLVNAADALPPPAGSGPPAAGSGSGSGAAAGSGAGASGTGATRIASDIAASTLAPVVSSAPPVSPATTTARASAIVTSRTPTSTASRNGTASTASAGSTVANGAGAMSVSGVGVWLAAAVAAFLVAL